MISQSDCQTCALAEMSPDGSVAACKAFPTGIPEPIIRGEIHHDEPFPGDHGITFTPVTGRGGSYGEDLHTL